MKLILHLLCLFIFLMTTSHASNLAREKRISDQIVDVIFDGDAIFLKDKSGHSFLSIYMQTDAQKIKGAAIIMHGRGMHPDWKDVTKPLRISLPEHGWHSLAIQMPVLEKSARYFDYTETFNEAGYRIESAIEFLKEQGINNIILIAHSCSVHMSMNWLRDNTDKNIKAYIGIGMGATDYKQAMARAFPLEQLTFPVLDLYGEHDYPAVKNKAKKRLELIKQAGNPKSGQLIVNGSDHYHKDNNLQLIKKLTQWLNTLDN